MSVLFPDIYEAIQTLRTQKGVCEKDILNYVEEKVGGCLKATNFMKTIRTLQKLVEDGVLMKKGKRFALIPCPSNQNNKSNEEEKEEEEEECEENEEEVELDMSDDECDKAEQNECEENGGDEDDEDDDDDDDDDDEDDDDDDDDDEEDDNECDEKEALVKDDPVKKDENSTENNPLKSVNKEGVIMSPKKTNENTSENNTSSFNNAVNCENAKGNNGSSNRRILSEETKHLMEQSDDIGKTETIAFCVRDFIDSLYRPKTDYHEQKANISNILMQEHMDAAEMEEVGKVSVSKKRKVRKQRDKNRCAYRSRSPIKKIKAEAFHSFKRDRSDEVCYWVASNQFLPEPMDEVMDVDLEKEDGVAANFDAFRHRSSVGPLSTNASDLRAQRKESSCSNQDNNKLSAGFEENNEYFFKKNVQDKPSQVDNNGNNPSNWFRSEEGDKEQENANRSFSVEDEQNASVEPQSSLCSFCDKNEINT